MRLSAAALADFDDIVDHLRIVAGSAVARRYASDIRATPRRLADYPGIGAPRTKFGRATRLIVVRPYSIYYDGEPKGDVVLVLRIMKGSRRVTRRLLGDARRQ